MIKPLPVASMSYGTRALLIWLGALVLFLICLGWVLFSGSASGGKSESKSSLIERQDIPGIEKQKASGMVLGGPPRGDMPAPEIPHFDVSQEYVLVGAGLQGLYQSSAPDDVWTLSYPVPQFNVQLIKRGPPIPQIITKGVKVSWELSAGQTNDSTVRQGQMEAVQDSHFQASIPASAVRADGILAPYRMIRLRAEDEKNGTLLVESAAVLAASPGFGCAHCHENAGTAILEVHDRRQGTRLKEQNTQGHVVACRSCHAGLTSGPTGEGQKQEGQGLSVSAAVHGWHAAYLTDRGADACMTCHVSQYRAEDDPKGVSRPMFARDFHVDRGLTCVRCHGFMEDHALALLKAEQEAGQAQAARGIASITAREISLDRIEARLPWVQEPDCASCHTFAEKPDLRTASAFNKWTARSDGLSGLFSTRKDDMGAVRCITCHGAPHAVYEARNPLARDLDNIPPLQYQEQAAALGAFGNCALCHGQSMEFSVHHPLVTRSNTEIHTPPGAKLTMPVARFSHQAHTPLVNCATCHHTGHEDGKPLLCTSSGCHDGLSAMLPEKNDAPKPDPRSFYNAFHGSYPGCIACHTESRAEGNPAGPTTCKACHQAPSSRWDS